MKPRQAMIFRTEVQRVTRSSDSGGGFDDSWAVVDSSVPCYAWPVSTRELVSSARPEVEHIRTVLVPPSTDVTEGDRLTSVTRKNGTVLYDGPLMVTGVSEYTDYFRLTTRKVT